MRPTIAILAAVFAATAIRATTITITCTADTGILEASPDANMGNMTHVPVGVTSTGNIARGLFRFDLSQIPSDATILGAALNIPVTFVPPDGVPARFELHRMHRQWIEGNKSGNLGQPAEPGEATWNMRTFQPWIVPGGLAGTGMDFSQFPSAAANIAATGVVAFTSDSLVAEVAFFVRDPISNNGWMLLEGSETTHKTAKRFGSREDAVNAPTLVIDYAAPETPLRFTGISKVGPNVVLEWSGGTPAYQVQATDNLNGQWSNLGQITTQSNALIPTSGSSQFFRLLDHQTAP